MILYPNQIHLKGVRMRRVTRSNTTSNYRIDRSYYFYFANEQQIKMKRFQMKLQLIFTMSWLV